MIHLSEIEEKKFRHEVEKWYKKNKIVKSKKIFHNKKDCSYYLTTRTPIELQLNIIEWLYNQPLSEIRVNGQISLYCFPDDIKKKYTRYFSKNELEFMHNNGVSIIDIIDNWSGDFLMALLSLILWYDSNAPFLLMFSRDVWDKIN